MVTAPHDLTTWSPADFRAWRIRLGLTQAAAARELGKSLKMVKLYERGVHFTRGTPVAIPRDVVLACSALEIGPMSILRRTSKSNS